MADALDLLRKRGSDEREAAKGLACGALRVMPRARARAGLLIALQMAGLLPDDDEEPVQAHQPAAAKPDMRRRENRSPRPSCVELHHKVPLDLAAKLAAEAAGLGMTRTDLFCLILTERYAPERLEVVA